MTGRFISDALLKKLALGTKITKIFYSLAFIVIGDTRQNLRLGELELELLRLRDIIGNLWGMIRHVPNAFISSIDKTLDRGKLGILCAPAALVLSWL